MSPKELAKGLFFVAILCIPLFMAEAVYRAGYNQFAMGMFAGWILTSIITSGVVYLVESGKHEI